MRHTLTAVFADSGAAQHALNKLLAAGFTRADAVVSLAAPPERTARRGTAGEEACRRVLTLTAESDMEADRAAGLIGRSLVSGVATAAAQEAGNGFPYRMRHWAAAAADRKARWTLRHGRELPPWEKFKDAVLHGWSRIDLGNDHHVG